MSETVTLREITADIEPAVRALTAPYGRDLFDVFTSDSLDEAATSPDARPWYRAIYLGDQPVGFVMLSFDVPPGHPEYPWRYFLWRLLIDPRYQRRGYGHAAMALVMDVVRRSPGGTELVTSVYPGEGGPGPFYRSLEFESTGEWSTARRSIDSSCLQVHRQTLAQASHLSPDRVALLWRGARAARAASPTQ